jgi:hypothetical protein
MTQLWRDMAIGSNEEIARLLRDRALLVMNLRVAEMVLDGLGAHDTAAQIRITLDTLEKADVQRLGDLEAAKTILRPLRADQTHNNGSAGPEASPQTETPAGGPQGGTSIEDALRALFHPERS